MHTHTHLSPLKHYTQTNKQTNKQTHTHTHTHTYIYIHELLLVEEVIQFTRNDIHNL